ncbi:ABC-2 family transporter protein [Roseimaritima multifibrata]|uniref:ABC-2 family transporter protein n=1 Tax=Roseimaritima multifibrata TaxID=1930274 RepID=A0A517MC29_9BACT|nr:ABC transporter permease [Roseimaritima multifibrata]QDS92450.1 ABC-2 family transporter protein [Roseimaritima multifibrata]
MLPIIRREFVAILRTRRAAIIQWLLAVCYTAIIVVRWPSDARADLSGANSQNVFGLFAYGLLAVVVLMTPIFPATSIVMERRTGTLALLLNSPLKTPAIYLGKLLGVLGFVVLMIAISLPSAAACYAMGGVDLQDQLVTLYGLLLVVAVQYVAVGLLVSSYAASADSAVRLTYGCVLGLSLITLGPYFLFQSDPGLVSSTVAWVRCLSPIPAVMQIAGQGDIGSLEKMQGWSALGRYVVLAMVSSLGMSMWTVYRLHFRCMDRSRSQGMVTDDKSLGIRAIRRVAFLVDPSRRSGSIGNWSNPVMIKEFRSRRFGRSHWMIRLVMVCAVLSLLIAFSVTAGTVRLELEAVGGPLVMLQVGLLVMFLPSLAAGLISSERESGAWPLLRSTPLSGGAIVRGKLLSVFWTMLLLIASTIPGYLVMLYIQPTVWVQVAQGFVCLILAGLLALMISATAGSIFRRTAAATTAAYICVLTLFGGSLLVWLARDAPFGFKTVENVLILNPMAAALSVFRIPGFAAYHLLPYSWYVSAALIVAMYFAMRLQVQRLTRPE